MSINNTTTKPTYKWSFELESTVQDECPYGITSSLAEFILKIHDQFPRAMLPGKLYEAVTMLNIIGDDSLYIKEIDLYRADVVIDTICMAAHNEMANDKDFNGLLNVITGIVNELTDLLQTELGESISGKITGAIIP